MRIAALLIDIDDTLLDDAHATRHGVAALLAAHQLPYTLDDACQRWHTLTQQHWLRFERGECSIIEQRHARLRGLFQRELSEDEATQAFEPYIAGYRSNWKAFDDTAAFVAATAHLPRVLVSNGHLDIQQRKLALTGLDAHFPHLLTPQNCGHAKPDAAIFEAAAALAGVPLQQCMVIGDDPVRDIGAAAALGLPHFHVDRQRAGGSLLDVLPLLDQGWPQGAAQA